MLVQDIFEWNKERDNLEFTGEVAFTMLTEELEEFAWAVPHIITDKFGPLTEEDQQNQELMEEIGVWLGTEEAFIKLKVKQLDALGDLAFVAIGEMGKILGKASAVEDVFNAIIAANNTKGKDKESGKITKPEDFVAPDGIIEKIVEETL